MIHDSFPAALALLISCLALMSCAQRAAPSPARGPAPPALDFTMNSIDGKPVNLADYRGRVILIVNVASKCGYTPQYAQLQQLHEQYHARGLAILGFPANEFGNQEPGTDEEIAAFCSTNYGVSFDMFSKTIVTGEGICPLYEHLTASEANPEFAGEVKWNFEKFLISRDGRIVGRFGSRVTPDSQEMLSAIERELGAG